MTIFKMTKHRDINKKVLLSQRSYGMIMRKDSGYPPKGWKWEWNPETDQFKLVKRPKGWI